MVNQIKVGEHSGTLSETLTTIARHCEGRQPLESRNYSQARLPSDAGMHGDARSLRSLLTYVVPVFKKTYDDAHVTLPLHHQVLIGVGAFAKSYGLIILGLVAVTVIVVRQLRKRPDFANKWTRRSSAPRYSAIGCVTSRCFS